KGFGEGDRLVSWIWLTEGEMGDGSDVTVNKRDPEVRIEWLKSHAWANRWREEVLMLKEEMWWMHASFRSLASDWES
ncbi:hypothetical protein EV421DRAFT_1719283, partial [Armillaria borealis]